MGPIRVLSLNSDDESHNDSESNPASQIYGHLHIPSTPVGIETMTFEHKIYMKAALKLLDQRDQGMNDKQVKRGKSCQSSTDIIKYGTLKKFSSGHLARIWKDKYVELRHGSFTYEDCYGWGQTCNRKTINLVAKKVKCYILMADISTGRFVFEISDAGGRSRSWKADSEDDMWSWVNAIKTAMIGSAGDFSAAEARDISYISRDSGSAGKTSSTYLRPITDVDNGCSFTCRVRFQNSHGPSCRYWSPEVQRCFSVQATLINAKSAEAYRDQLAVYTSGSVFTIPVSFLTIHENAHASLGVEQNPIKKSKMKKIASTRKAVSIERSQAWKDLRRDIITINGDAVSGGINGPDAMLGSLTRHILLKIQEMRSRYMDCPMPSCSSSAQRVESHHNNPTIYADLDEGLALSCARDVLLSCSRTRSGGDTYYMVESLFVNKSFAILTPLACNADPLEIVVDIVESDNLPEPLSGEDGNNCSAFNGNNKGKKEEMALQKSVSPNLLCNMKFSVGEEAKCFCKVVSPTCIPSEVLSEKDAGLKLSSHIRSARSLVCDKSEISSSTEASMHSSACDKNCKYVVNEKEEESILDEGYNTTTQEREHDLPLPQSADSVLIPSKLDRCLTIDTKGDQQNVLERLTEGYRRDIFRRAYSKRYEIKAAPTTNPSEEEAADGVSNKMFDNNTECRPWKRSSTFKNSVRATSGYCNKTDNILHLQDRPKSQFLGFKSSSIRKDILASSAESGRKTDNEFSVGSDDGAYLTTCRKNNFLKRTFGFNSRSTLSSGKKIGYNGQESDVISDSDQEADMTAQSMCIRIQVRAKSKYRLCNRDPQHEDDDNWAIIYGTLYQSFFLKSNSNSQPSVSDRLVTVKVDHYRQSEPKDICR